MDTKSLLKEVAAKFQALLEKYAKSDGEVEDFLNRITPWFERIKNNEITPPDYDYKLYAYFANPDLSPLAEKYRLTDLGEASAEFTLAIRDMKITHGK